MSGVEVAEIAGLTFEVHDVCEINGVSNKSGGVDEVICDFVTGKQGHLRGYRSTMMGPMRLRVPVKLLEKMMRT